MSIIQAPSGTSAAWEELSGLIKLLSDPQAAASEAARLKAVAQDAEAAAAHVASERKALAASRAELERERNTVREYISNAKRKEAEADAVMVAANEAKAAAGDKLVKAAEEGLDIIGRAKKEAKGIIAEAEAEATRRQREADESLAVAEATASRLDQREQSVEKLETNARSLHAEADKVLRRAKEKAADIIEQAKQEAAEIAEKRLQDALSSAFGK